MAWGPGFVKELPNNPGVSTTLTIFPSRVVVSIQHFLVIDDPDGFAKKAFCLCMEFPDELIPEPVLSTKTILTSF